MGKFLSGGIAVVLACSTLDNVCIAERQLDSEVQRNAETVKFRVIVSCIQQIYDTFQIPRNLAVFIYKSSKPLATANVPEGFLEDINRKRVVLESDPLAIRPGVSAVFIYLDQIGVVANGIVVVDISEIQDGSQKFLHEFSVAYRGGDLIAVKLERTIEL